MWHPRPPHLQFSSNYTYQRILTITQLCLPLCFIANGHAAYMLPPPS